MTIVKLISASLLLCISVISHAYAATCDKKSAPTLTSLFELYTSEGCSSCPVADRWLSELAPEVLSQGDFVALAFHVDYWDRLGWKDRFADPAYTARQKINSKVNGSAFVFTPQIVLAGRNYERWQDSKRVQKDVHKLASVAPDASITLRQQSVTSRKASFEITAQLRAGTNYGDVRIYTALYQNGLESDVGKGENSGRMLHHDYVVRSFYTSDTIGPSGSISVNDSFALPADAKPDAMGVAVFAQDLKTGVVLQAMAAPLCLAGK